jgi:hypothetical protein
MKINNKMIKPIESSKQALRESMKLEKVWSEETNLSQRTLIYIAELLEKQNKMLAKLSKH